jgi:hypothetical protein
MPMPLCDTLLRCAEEPPLYLPIWSEETLAEVQRAMLKRGYTAGQSSRRIAAMQDAFPTATVRPEPNASLACSSLPDPKDRHVIEAAIHSGTDLIVTTNLRHFPASILKALGIRSESPDDFLIRLYRENPDRVIQVIEAQRQVFQGSATDLHARLRKTAPKFVELVSGAV